MSDTKQRLVRFPKGSVIDHWAQNQENFSLSVRKLIEAIIPIYGDKDYIDTLNKISVDHLRSELNTSQNSKLSSSQVEVSSDLQSKTKQKQLLENQSKLEKNTKLEKNNSNDENNDEKMNPFEFLS